MTPEQIREKAREIAKTNQDDDNLERSTDRIAAAIRSLSARTAPVEGEVEWFLIEGGPLASLSPDIADRIRRSVRSLLAEVEALKKVAIKFYDTDYMATEADERLVHGFRAALSTPPAASRGQRLVLESMKSNESYAGLLAARITAEEGPWTQEDRAWAKSYIETRTPPAAKKDEPGWLQAVRAAIAKAEGK